MAKSMVEKYEQILSADPGSMVFVELAKALLDRGDSKRAIDVCQDGLQHHPESVVGRVLWGKALISVGKPAEAMQQFDEAIAVDRENPYAYNLIGEVLLHKGLHRSALPILKKAVALQPNDTRVRQWLDQTTRALNGEKVTAQPQYTTVDPVPGTTSDPQPSPPQPVRAEAATSHGDPTVTDARAYVPSTVSAGVSEGAAPVIQAEGEPEVMRGMTDMFQSLAAREAAAAPASSSTVASAPAETLAPRPRVMTPGPMPVPALPALEGNAPAADPLAPDASLGRALNTGTVPYGKSPLARPHVQPLEPEVTDPHGLANGEHIKTNPGAPPPAPQLREDEATIARAATPTRIADEEPPPDLLAQPGPVNVLARDPATTVAPPSGLGQDEQVRMTRPHDEEAPLPPELVAATLSPGGEPRPDHTMPGPPPPAPGSRGPDDTADLPPAPVATPVVPGAAAPAGGPPPLKGKTFPKMPALQPAGPPPMPSPKQTGKLLLPDLPASSPPTPSMELPKVELSSQAAEAIAKEYERELREKLAAAANRPKTFWQKNGLKLGAGALFLALCGVGYGVFRYAKHASADLPKLMAQAHAGIEKDTQSSYQASLTALSDLLDVSPDNAEAHALAAYAHAVVYREHGEEAKEREAALSELGHPEIEQLYPELAAAARYYLADNDAEARAAAKPLLAGKGAEAHEIAGKILLDSDPRKAVEQFQESLKAQSAHVRTYVAIADYYLKSGEPSVAENMLDRARELSDHHPGVLLGLVDARLAQNKELDQATADLALLEKDADKLDPDTRARLDLATGRLLANQGQGDAGLQRLEQGLARAPSHAFEFHQALAEAHAMQGAYDKSLSELLQAQKAKPGADKDLALLDQIARAELALGRTGEALRLTEKLDDRRIHLTRGIALFEQGSLDAAKRELLLTRRDKNMPTEAACYLARAEIAAGHKDDAKPAIDAIFTAGKLSPEAQVARGELLWASSDAAGAQTSFAAAAEDRREYEAPYLLGKLLLSQGKLADAKAPLEQSLSRNHFYGEAHKALGRLLLAEGDTAGARSHLSIYLKEHKDDAQAMAGMARANLAIGDLSDARNFAQKATEHPGRDAEVNWTRTQVDLAAGDGSLVLRELAKRAAALRSADAWCDLGDAAFDMDDVKAAASAYEKADKMEHGLSRARVGVAAAQAHLQGKAALKELTDLAAPANKLPPLQQARVLAEEARLSPAAEQKDRATAAVAVSDASAPAHLALGLALGRTAEGQAELSRAVALEPALAEAHVALAEADSALGDRAHAVSEAAAALRIASSGSVAARARALAGGAAEPTPRPTHAKGGRKRKGK